MRVPSRLQVTGPLAEYADGFREELIRQGYQQTSAANHLYLLAHMSRWMVSQGLNPGELTPARVEEFLGARRADGYVIRLSQQGVAPLLGYLRALGVVPTPPEPVSTAPVEVLVESYSNYLAGERGLAAGTVCRYARVARLFLSDCERPDGLDVGCLTAGDVTAFVVRQCRSRPVASAKVLVTGLRSLLRFLLLEAYTDRHLAPAVLTATGWAGESLPQALGPEVVAGMLASCDQHTE